MFAGSSSQSESSPDWPSHLLVGRIVRPHGVRGELAVKLMTDYPEHLAQVETLYIGQGRQPYTVKHIRPHAEGVLLLLEGITSRDSAEAFRQEMLYIHIDDAIPLEEGEYYLFQIEGIQVVTEEGRVLGRLSAVLETGANDVYVVQREDGRELLLPVIPQVIRNVDVVNQIMTVHLLEGLE